MRKDDMKWYDMKYDMKAAESSMIKWSLHYNIEKQWKKISKN